MLGSNFQSASRVLEPKILFKIAGGVGTPISLDENTKRKIFGHFARVLVDVDLFEKLPFDIMVERDGFAFFVGVEYERLPSYCNHRQSIGHSIDNCRKNSVNPQTKTVIDQTMQQKINAVYVPKQLESLQAEIPKIGPNKGAIEEDLG